MANVKVHSGTVVHLLKEAGVTANGAGNWVYKDSPFSSFHATIAGTGAVSATVTIEVSNDGVNAVETDALVISLTGTTSASDGGLVTNAPWKYVRALVASISGTGATVKCLMGV